MTNKLPTGGFTLIEMLVAVFLLTVAISGPLTISSKGLTVALVAKDQTTAFYLAQDAVEYVRSVRDTNTLKGRSWLAGLDGSPNPDTPPDGVSGDCVSAAGTASCYFDSLGNFVSGSANFASCGGDCPKLLYNAPMYNYTTGTQTIFKRTVSITSPSNGAANEAVLRVTLSWSDIGGVTRTITVTEDLFNWQ